MRISVATYPSEYPLSVSDAKTHLRVDGSADDAAIESCISAATIAIEKMCGLAIIEKTFVWTIDAFPENDIDTITFPIHPVSEIVSIVYDDEDGNEQTVSAGDYTLVADDIRPAVALTANASWPSAVTDTPGGVRITFKAGFSPDDMVSPPDSRANIPAPIVHALKILTGRFYEERVPDSPRLDAVSALLAPWRARAF